MKARYLWGALVAAVFGAGVAYAQFTGQMPSATAVTNTHLTDLVEINPFGVGAAPQGLATIPQIAGIVGYSFQVPITAFSITVPHNTYQLILNPAGTLATGTITLDANPSDGQRFCWLSTQIQTAVTITAPSGQTLGGAATETAGAANVNICRTWVASTSTWYRY